MASGFELIGPGGFGWAITPSDITALPLETRAIYVGTGGDLAVMQFDPTTLKLTAVTYANVASGTVLPIKTLTVLATGTTATSIRGMA